jgi:hypothetical protein
MKVVSEGFTSGSVGRNAGICMIDIEISVRADPRACLFGVGSRRFST